MRNRTPMVEILIGSLAGLTSAALAVGVFFLSSDFLMMFAATPCILGLAGILAGFLAGRPVHGSGLRGGVVAGAVAALVSGAAAALATLLFSPPCSSVWRVFSGVGSSKRAQPCSARSARSAAAASSQA